MIPRRKLGRTGLAAPILGFGVSGPHGGTGASLGATKRLIAACLEADAGLFDTAPFYGDAEHRLGEALKGAPRDKAILITKVGTKRLRNGVQTKDFSAAGVRASVESSLRNLGVSHVDIVLLHGPPVSGPPPECMEALLAMKQAGHIRAIGVCGRGHEIETAMACEHIDVIQAPLWTNGWSAIAAERNLGFLGIEVLRAAVDGFRIPRQSADLWYLARSVRDRGLGALAQPRADKTRVRALLKKALTRTGVTAAILTTTRLTNLAFNLEVAASLLDAPVDAP
jgi:aryl-alcohol dehydrogenase-like predicted oxidoreductase